MRLIALAFLAALASVSARAEPLAECLAALRAERPSDLSAESFDRFTAGVTDLRSTIAAATATQPEFTVPVWDYLARLVDAERVADGRTVRAFPRCRPAGRPSTPRSRLRSLPAPSPADRTAPQCGLT